MMLHRPNSHTKQWHHLFLPFVTVYLAQRSLHWFWETVLRLQQLFPSHL
jgi:hypothetical protein